ncbi:MAG TPA: hypothetical protein HPP83_04425 [Candidatus Hydrogenedentes bacterium]|nr:hypothetical protein [Candidatus Hydrogenedentota bacterium]
MVEKPLIYLYPETEHHVTLKLRFDGTLLHTYPEYGEDGWHVLAKPSGELLDLNTQAGISSCIQTG